MKITSKRLHEVAFPVFMLPRGEELEIVDGLVRVYGKVVDDRNVNQPTLALRRLHTPMPHVYRLRRALETPVDLIKCRKTNIFIDSLGYIFYYRRTISTKVKCHRVKDVISKDTYSLLILEGIPSPFKVTRPPPPGHKYAYILYRRDRPWLLYEYLVDKAKDLMRKI